MWTEKETPTPWYSFWRSRRRQTGWHYYCGEIVNRLYTNTVSGNSVHSNCDYITKKMSSWVATPRASKCVPWCGASSLYCTANSKMKVYCDFYSEDVWVQIIHALLSVFLFLWMSLEWRGGATAFVERDWSVVTVLLVHNLLWQCIQSESFIKKEHDIITAVAQWRNRQKNVLFGSGVMRNLQHSVVMQRHNPQDDVFQPDDSLPDMSFVGMCPVYYWSVPSSGWQCVLRVLLTVRRDIIDAGCWLLSLCQAVCL